MSEFFKVGADPFWARCQARRIMPNGAGQLEVEFFDAVYAIVYDQASQVTPPVRPAVLFQPGMAGLSRVATICRDKQVPIFFQPTTIGLSTDIVVIGAFPPQDLLPFVALPMHQIVGATVEQRAVALQSVLDALLP